MPLGLRREHKNLYSLLLRTPQLSLSYATGYRIPPKPMLMFWESTWRCPERCLGCNRPLMSLPAPDLTTDEALKLIDDAYALGVRIIVITGGDPLVRRDVPDIALQAKSKGMVTVVCTPGILIHSKNIERLLECFDVFDISLDSLQPEVHDRLRGRRGAFTGTMRAIQLIAKHKQSHHGLVITSRVMDANHQELGEINRQLSKLGAVTAMQPLHQDLYGARTDDKFAWTKENEDTWQELIDSYQWYDAFSKLALKEFHRQIPVYATDAGHLKQYRCFAGSYSFVIDPMGTLFACDALRQPLGNIREQPLRDLWLAMRDVRCVISSSSRPCNCWLLSTAPPSLFLSKCIGWWPLEHPIKPDVWGLPSTDSHVSCDTDECR